MDVDVDSGLRSIIARHMKIKDQDLINDDSRFIEDLDADLLDIIFIINDAEDEFRIRINGESEDFCTVGDLSREIKNTIAGQR